ncbi:GlxA family transcriptional regulator [Streptomyces niveus]|uniref:GlxA family transcriptional regulator n=1 Tax=Streptomyces niveus TaxID=193462 RepID=UPI00369A32EF
MQQRRVVFVIFEGFQSLDLSGPFEVFQQAGRPDPGYDCRTVAPAAGPVRSGGGLRVHADHGIGDLDPSGIDTLVVAGGNGVDDAVRDPALVGWIAEAATTARRITSVCSGVFLLAATGLLTGRRVTTHWSRDAQLRREHPGLSVDTRPIFVRDGPVWTSAGVTAGMDLALALVEDDLGRVRKVPPGPRRLARHFAALSESAEYVQYAADPPPCDAPHQTPRAPPCGRTALLCGPALGREAAHAVAQRLVLFLRRPGSQAQFSVPLWSAQPATDPIRTAVAAVHADPGAPHTLADLAGRAGLSPRHLQRRFTAELGMGPAEYVERVRVEAAQRALTGGDEPVTAIARRCGLGSSESLRRAFHRHCGVTPTDYRNRFRTTDDHT